MGIRTKPKITWGAVFANTITFGFPLFDVLTYPAMRAGSEMVQSQSGVEDSWDGGRDYLVEGKARWIPGTVSGGVTGWDDASTGWSDFLEWAWQKNQFRFFPDAASGTFYTVYLVQPDGSAPPAEVEEDGTRAVKLLMRGATKVLGY